MGPRRSGLFHGHVLRVLAGSLHTAKAADFANLPRAHARPLLERLVNGTSLGYLKQSQALFGRQLALKSDLAQETVRWIFPFDLGMAHTNPHAAHRPAFPT